MTKIEWTDETWNPVTGCTKVSQGCKNCYAERLAPKVFAGQRIEYPPNNLPARPRVFTDVWTHADRLDAPLRWKKPRRIFVNSMSDLFHEDVPDEFILQVFDVMRQCANGWTPRLGGERGKLVARHTFQILTKRAQRMLDFCSRLRFAQNDGRGMFLARELPHNGFNPMRALTNVWLGVSVEDQATADERIPLLLQTPAAVRFLSCEPLLGPIDLHAHMMRFVSSGIEYGRGFNRTDVGHMRPSIDWVIAGGESGPKARPSHPDWFRSLRDQCAAAGVPYFFKQWGEWWPIGQMPNGYLDEENNHPKPRGSCVLQLDGRVEFDFPKGAMTCYKVGKKTAGRLLDGREHMEYPA